jgi:hypothetical protein
MGVIGNLKETTAIESLNPNDLLFEVKIDERCQS